MKKAIIFILLLVKTSTANCDVIYFPYQYTIFCYSAELIYSFEKVKKTKNTTNYWGGIGVVGSFYFLEEPTYGLELAIEKRHYFQQDKFKSFFISAYIGTAYMTDFKYISDIGIVPGIKINYKAQISKKLILEPYLSLSLPITYDLKGSYRYTPFPAMTIGARFGLGKLKNKNMPKA